MNCFWQFMNWLDEPLMNVLECSCGQRSSLDELHLTGDKPINIKIAKEGWSNIVSRNCCSKHQIKSIVSNMMINHNFYYTHSIDLLSYNKSTSSTLLIHNTDAIQTLCDTLEHVTTRYTHVMGKLKRTPTQTYADVLGIFFTRRHTQLPHTL